MKTIRWGIIGCGNVTEVKSGPGFQKARHSQLVAVMRRNGELAEDYARRHAVPKWYDDAEALIYDPEVDAVYIATPPSSHKDYTLAVAEAKKPVYVEKPMARSYAECQDMITACEKQNVPLFVAYYRRALPRFLKVQELLAQKAIGEPRFVQNTYYRRRSDLDREESNWRVKPEIAGGGYFVDLASHTIDLLQFLLGPITAVQGFARNQMDLYPAEDMVTATFKFQSGLLGSGSWCFGAYADLDRVEIVGSAGKIEFSTFGETPIVYDDGKQCREFSGKNPPHIQQPLIQSVVDDLNGTGKCPSTGQSAASTNHIMDQILSDYYAK